MQAYSDPRRENDPYALPNIEVFYRTARTIRADDWRDDDGDLMEAGWYWWACFPGCLPDGEPEGPFETQEDALADAQDDVDDDSAGR